MSATDPTRPVRDQIAEALAASLWPDYEKQDAAMFLTDADQMLAVPIIADALTAAAERDALRATVDLRVELNAAEGQPTTCKVWRGGALIFDGVSALDGATQAAPRPAECGICGATGDQVHAVKPHADAGIWPEDDTLAAQGVPLTEDPPPLETRADWGNPRPLTEDPQR